MSRVALCIMVSIFTSGWLCADPEAATLKIKSILLAKELRLTQVVNVLDGGSVGLKLSDEKGNRFLLVAVTPYRFRQAKSPEQVFIIRDISQPATEQADTVNHKSEHEEAIIKLLTNMLAKLEKDQNKDKEIVKLMIPLLKDRTKPWPF